MTNDTNTELIPVFEHEGKQVASGRKLHEALGIGTRYDTWFARMLEYGFAEGQDFCSILGESTGGRPGTDHAVTFDMAKELGMIQRTPEGKRVRQYFIEVEKRARETQPLAAPELVSRADLARMVLESEEEKSVLAAAIESQKPIVSYHERFVAESDDMITVDNFAAQFGSSGPAVRALMKEKSVAIRRTVGRRWSQTKGQMVEEFEWRPRQNVRSSEWFELRPQHNAPRLHNGQVRQTMYVRQFYALDLAQKLGLTEEAGVAA